MPVKGRRLRSPINWIGSKGRMVAKLLPYIPAHRIYVELFGGGASMLVARDPSDVEVYNDLNSGLVNFFRVLRDQKQFKQFHRLAQLTPYAREEFDLCKQTWREVSDPVERAHRWFVVARMSFGGNFHSWGYGVTGSCRGMASQVSRYLGAVENLPEISARLLQVQVENKDAFDLIACYDSPDTFFYLDPPYVPSTRKSGGYEHELTDESHRRLVKVLQGIEGKAMLSGYANPIYAELERAGWQRRDWETLCSLSGRTRLNGLRGAGAAKLSQKRVESIWFNYEVKEAKGELALEP
jgi:DNA adenine methylase